MNNLTIFLLGATFGEFLMAMIILLFYDKIFAIKQDGKKK